jgi:hypothetical protein
VAALREKEKDARMFPIPPFLPSFRDEKEDCGWTRRPYKWRDVVDDFRDLGRVEKWGAGISLVGLIVSMWFAFR